jgi:hypothetical protein
MSYLKFSWAQNYMIDGIGSVQARRFSRSFLLIDAKIKVYFNFSLPKKVGLCIRPELVFCGLSGFQKSII